MADKIDLTDFLIELAEDPAKLTAFKADPRQVMKDAGLPRADQKLLLSGDEAAVREAINNEKTVDFFVTIVFVSVMIGSVDD